MNAMALLLAVTTSMIVLHSGDEIVVQGEVREENGVVMFRTAGVLYSLPAKDVDRITRLEDAQEAKPAEPEVRAEPDKPRLRLSEEERRRLIAELEKNHAGTAPPRQKIFEEPLPEREAEERTAGPGEEMRWRRQARAHEEEVRRATDELQLLQRRAEDLQSKILSLMSLGYQPDQFSYDTMMLMRTRDQIPRAQQSLEAAQRANSDFRETARRQGILPGWLR